MMRNQKDNHSAAAGEEAFSSGQQLQALSDQALEPAGVRHYSLNRVSTDLIPSKHDSGLRRSLNQPTREIRLAPARLDPHLVVFNDSDPGAAERYNNLAVSLLATASRRPCRRVVITSAQHGEGRTCVLLNLAAALARINQRVLVIDTDLLQPSVLRLLGAETEVGLAELLRHNLSPGEASLRVTPGDFHLIAARERGMNAAEILASPALTGLLQMVDPDYDFILFDSPPLLESANTHLLMRLADAALMVIQPGRNKASQLAQAVSLFTEENLCGVVLNRLDA